ncbi:type VII secretion target [Kitasatospora sp. NPDC050543]|uniref:type VII secretion target n=1 Tax=Kitasatospora sp. NPDC050543 TaxID=3364054 RepID=UPI0037B582C2
MSGFTVKPDELDGAATSGHAVAEAIRQEVPQVAGPSTGLEEALYGLRIGSAAEHCATAWQKHLGDLAASLDVVAQNLTTTATEYRRAEEGNSMRLDAIKPGS